VRELSLLLFLSVWISGASPVSEIPPFVQIDEIYTNADSIADLKKSESLIRGSLDKFPDDPDLIWRLARNYFRLATRTQEDEGKLRFLEQCFETAERGAKVDGQSAENIYFRGLCLGKISLEKGLLNSLFNKEPFRTTMEQLIAMDPSVENGGPHRALGVYYASLPFFLGGRNEKAIEHFKLAVKLAPQHAENYYYLGRAYYNNNDYPKAEKAFVIFIRYGAEIKNDLEMPKQIREAEEWLKEIRQATSSEE